MKTESGLNVERTGRVTITVTFPHGGSHVLDNSELEAILKMPVAKQYVFWRSPDGPIFGPYDTITLLFDETTGGLAAAGGTAVRIKSPQTRECLLTDRPMEGHFFTAASMSEAMRD